MLGARVRVDISVIGLVTVWNSVVLYVDGARVLVIVLRWPSACLGSGKELLGCRRQSRALEHISVHPRKPEKNSLCDLALNDLSLRNAHS